MEPVKTVKGVDIYEEGDDWVEMIEHWINDPGVAEKINGGAIVMAETTLNNNFLQHCYGVDIAIDLLKDNPERTVVCISSLPINHVRGLNPNLDIFGSYPNSLFVCFAFTDKSFLEQLEESRLNKENMFPNGKRAEAISRYASKVISIAVHDLKVDDPKNPKDDREQDIVHRVIKDVKDVFPSMRDVSDEEVIDFIYETNSQREEVMKGKELEGVYCDVEGTYIVDGKLNRKVARILDEHYQKGNKITLWSDGDIDKLSSKLKELGIDDTVRAKADFAGATAEIVIDDLDEFTFTARTKIRAKEFIQV